mmetsp:Transcript_14456/g.14075  ORF Transcript_14456/g.14075 Transcript_14456/m.14075 type:complete len:94 (-) Transcript_14456:69-350(-)
MIHEMNKIREEERKETIEDQQENFNYIHKKLTETVDPIRILLEKILKTESTLIMNEATKALKNLAKKEEVIRTILQGDAMTNIFREKFDRIDP